MDAELLRLVKAVRDGAITDPERVRDILGEARQRLERSYEKYRRREFLVAEAERAFLRGWQPKT